MGTQHPLRRHGEGGERGALGAAHAGRLHRDAQQVDDVDEHEGAVERAAGGLDAELHGVVALTVEQHELGRRAEGAVLVEVAGEEDGPGLEQLLAGPVLPEAGAVAAEGLQARDHHGRSSLVSRSSSWCPRAAA